VKAQQQLMERMQAMRYNMQRRPTQAGLPSYFNPVNYGIPGIGGGRPVGPPSGGLYGQGGGMGYVPGGGMFQRPGSMFPTNHRIRYVQPQF
jgi:hypothetical protein